MKITSVLKISPTAKRSQTSPVIGVPRALSYFEYLPLWRAFFEALGCRVVISPETNKKILDDGVQAAVEEACLPVKLYYGHVKALSGKVDYVFVPRLISVAKKTYVCPKFMGVPDMVRTAAHFDRHYPELLIVDVNHRLRGGGWNQALVNAGTQLGFAPAVIRRGLQAGRQAQDDFEVQLHTGINPAMALADWEKRGRAIKRTGPKAGKDQAAAAPGGLVIAVIGHPYQIFDRFVSLNLLGKLQAEGVRVITASAVADQVGREATSHLPKRLFWSFGQKLLGGSLHLLEQPIDGLIYVAAFGCGPDSMVGEIVERHAKRADQVPFLMLTIDEHTGEAGVNTRLEAFLDLITRKKHESSIKKTRIAIKGYRG
ncbi:MAG: acyl-CoA dehydratase activase-related protein [Heliobacteriaceae bacterium]|nr:acyl-CoA dehydratase activase-related protein [Heliobacteriaceae bacterium]MDD4587307.1 acyl-CoA dehydratase activase-related protein [Heliobacteriaceae bacterium]